MHKLQLICIGFLLLAAAKSPAFDLSGVGVLNFTDTRGSNSGATTTSRGTSFGFGALLTGDSGTFFNFEIGALYIPRKFNINNGASTDETLNMLEVPVLLRFSVPLLSIGAGGYYARGLGNVHNTVGGADIQSTYQSVGLGQNDFGLTLSAGLHLPVFPLVHLIVDVRYNYGLVNMAQAAGVSVNLTDLQFMGGIELTL